MDLPQSPEALASATWADVAPYYEALATAPLTASTAASWLRDGSRREELIGEAAAVATIEYTCDTENAAKEAAHLRFADELLEARPVAQPCGRTGRSEWSRRQRFVVRRDVGPRRAREGFGRLREIHSTVFG